MSSVSNRLRCLVATSVVIATSLAAVGAAAAQSSSEKPKATEVGVTASEIHIAIVADVDNAIAPGLFQGGVNGVQGAAKYLNSKAGGGGLAGRKVVVDFYDAKLNPSETRNAVINACQSDLAMVGTETIFLSNMDDATNCKDQAGQATGMPDIPSFATGIPEACSAVSFPVQGNSLDCATVAQNPQTYWATNGGAQYLVKKNNNDLHGVFIISGDTKDATRGSTILALGQQKAGIKGDMVPKGGRDPQSAYTPVVQQMKTDNSNFASSTLTVGGMVELRSEAQIQGLDASKISWVCSTCYGDKATLANSDTLDGTYQQIGFLPFEEAKYNKTLAAFVKNVKDPDSFSAYSFEATMAFADAINSVVAKDGVNGITRASTLAALRNLTDFDAGGMAGAHSFKDGRLSKCFVLTQFKSGKWVRVTPSKKGTFDCTPSNQVTIKANINGV